jgi:hypothetical protein
MYAIIDWRTRLLLVEEGTGRIQLFRTEYQASSYARSNLHEGLWTVIEVPEDAMLFIE